MKEIRKNTIKEIRKNKKIQFDHFRDVVIIPTKEEYVNFGVWWSEADYIEFKKSAIKEVMLFLNSYNNLNLNQALSILYSPEYFPHNYKLC